ncbi:MAG TPA: hypothetical protein VHD87_10560 [Acidimicrobiales bacterium]|nr:hypothetical protein [Acidimicrobiales bacterium]
MMWGVFGRRRHKQPDAAGPRDLYDGLRNQILDLDPSSAELRPTTELPRVWGALLETGYEREVATLVSLSDGTTSLYTTSGFAIIGGGAHPQVVQATQRFLAAVESSLDDFDAEAEASLPADAETIIRALTFEGRRSVRAPEEDFGYGRHPLSAVFHAGEAVIAELRRLHDAREDQRGG